jgi:DNA-binding NarL/FixJ family response regulator
VIRIVLVDDQELFRGGVRVALDAQPDLEVVGEAGDGRQGLAVVDEVRPDVVLRTVSRPCGRSSTGAGRIRRASSC